MNHYDRLGVPNDADPSVIRDAYRRLARVHHPDARGGRPSPDMPAINEAYGVLSDPARRLDYDRMLRAGPSPGRPSSSPGPSRTVTPPPLEPPRFPWRFVLGVFVLGATAIFVIGAFTTSSPPPGVDNVLQVGSCVTIDDRVGEVTEARCTDVHAGVVQALVPFDARCPTGLVAYRDRQGLGVACVRRVVTTDP